MVRKVITKGEALKAAKSPTRKPPAPFTPAPPVLSPFLDSLDKEHVYVVHVDKFPADFKKRIFTVPVILNLSIALFLVWRIWYIVPFYMAILNTVLGYDSSATIDRDSKTKFQLTWILLGRTLSFCLDFVLFRFILPWPITFFLESPGNPCLWRWKVGFREQEIVVRESRHWGCEDLLEGVKTGQNSPFFKTRILPSIEKKYMQAKTGYMMMDKNFDLDFHGMVIAHKLVDDKKATLKDFEKSVLAYSEDLGWLIWQVWRMDEQTNEEESRRKIVALKDKLTAMGKESLFFRWIEIVQYETSQPGGFTIERQRVTLKKVQDAFEEQGVDFEKLIQDVGGLEGTPGMEGDIVGNDIRA